MQTAFVDCVCDMHQHFTPLMSLVSIFKRTNKGTRFCVLTVQPNKLDT